MLPPTGHGELMGQELCHELYATAHVTMYGAGISGIIDGMQQAGTSARFAWIVFVAIYSGYVCMLACMLVPSCS
jgi:hypothetical protein